jgi:hypothetical protein
MVIDMRYRSGSKPHEKPRGHAIIISQRSPLENPCVFIHITDPTLITLTQIAPSSMVYLSNRDLPGSTANQDIPSCLLARGRCLSDRYLHLYIRFDRLSS